MRSEYTANQYLHTTRARRVQVSVQSGGLNYYLLALLCVLVGGALGGLVLCVGSTATMCVVVAVLAIVMMCNRG